MKKPDLISVAVLMLLCSLAAARARAQDAPPDPSQAARVRLGPLALSPTIALTNAGVDDNVSTIRPMRRRRAISR